MFPLADSILTPNLHYLSSVPDSMKRKLELQSNSIPQLTTSHSAYRELGWNNLDIHLLSNFFIVIVFLDDVNPSSMLHAWYFSSRQNKSQKDDFEDIVHTKNYSLKSIKRSSTWCRLFRLYNITHYFLEIH